MAWDTAFESAFHPKSVTFIGISSKAKGGPGGAAFLTTYQQMGFQGKIYVVNATVNELMGYKTYPRVSAIPEQVDLVIITAPARAVPDILEDCIMANAKNIHLFSAGFEETGEEEGKELGKKVRDIALRGGLRIIGPNCMGLYVPASRMGYQHLPSDKSGPVSFVFQSGGHSDWFIYHGPDYGIYFNKGISFGNGWILDSTDYLEYLKTDLETKIICMYLEGVKDGRKLVKLVKEINPVKPIILWKGGLTAAGSRAASSHTGSMAGQANIWQAFFTQTGATPVNSLEEMAETTMTFLLVKPPQGKRVAVLGMGGGVSVYAADACGRAGLEVPLLSQSTRDELKKLITDAGSSIKNPIDTAATFFDISLMTKTLGLIASDPVVDMLILMPHLNLVKKAGPEQVNKLINCITDFALNNSYRKPVVVVFHSFVNEAWEIETRAKLKVELPNKGVAVYRSLDSSARSLAKFYEYHRKMTELRST
jgi:acyl-CoA synthetase (NDP forming)